MIHVAEDNTFTQVPKLAIQRNMLPNYLGRGGGSAA